MPVPHAGAPNVLPGMFGNVATGAFGAAMGAVDRFAGENTRKRLENGVDQLAASTFSFPTPHTHSSLHTRLPPPPPSPRTPISPSAPAFDRPWMWR